MVGDYIKTGLYLYNDEKNARLISTNYIVQKLLWPKPLVAIALLKVLWPWP